MTAESLKPFLNLPANATAGDLKAHCAQRSSAKRCLAVLGCILVAAVCGTLIGVQIWHLGQTAALQREVDDLKLQLQLFNRAGEFNDYEFDNELFVNPDEYDAGYEPELDLDLPRERDASELLESGLTSSGMRGDEDDENEGEDDEDRRRSGEDLRQREDYEGGNDDDDDTDDGGNGDDDDDDDDAHDGDEAALYDTEDISVTAAGANGKRRARSISGVTRQGVPIVDEPYVPRRDRTRPQPHRIFEQMRQRPEELVTPPTSAEMFRWDVEGRSTHGSQRPVAAQQQSFGSISIRPFPQEAHHPRQHHYSSTTPMPVHSSPANPLYFSRNELNTANPTKPPAQILNRMSRVQVTGGSVREKLQQHTRLPKVISNPGTQKELVRSPESRVRMRHRKAGGTPHPTEPVGKGVHLVKQYVHGVRHRNMRHEHWSATDAVNQQAVASSTFRLENNELTVREPGLYYIYAQVTYDNVHDQNGFKVLVQGQTHLSCSVHSRGDNINTCFTAGLAKIVDVNARIVIEDVESSRHHIMHPEKTFFGAFKVGRLAPQGTQQQQQQQQQLSRRALG